MDMVLAILAGTLGGLAILASAHWIPLYLAREDAAWWTEMLEQHANPHPHQPAEPVVMPPSQQLRILAPLSILLGIAVAVACVSISGWSARTGLTILFAWSLSTLALIDIRIRLLPDLIVLPMLWLGILLQTVPVLATIGLEMAIWGAAAGYMLLWVPAKLFGLLRRVEAMGHGDFKLMALIGGWLGPASIIWILLVASTAAVAFNLFRGADRHTEFPFGPWLIAAAVGQMVLTGAGL